MSKIRNKYFQNMSKYFEKYCNDKAPGKPLNLKYAPVSTPKDQTPSPYKEYEPKLKWFEKARIEWKKNEENRTSRVEHEAIEGYLTYL